jgi:hypothetical protein
LVAEHDFPDEDELEAPVLRRRPRAPRASTNGTNDPNGEPRVDPRSDPGEHAELEGHPDPVVPASPAAGQPVPSEDDEGLDDFKSLYPEHSGKDWRHAVNPQVLVMIVVAAAVIWLLVGVLNGKSKPASTSPSTQSTPTSTLPALPKHLTLAQLVTTADGICRSERSQGQAVDRRYRKARTPKAVAAYLRASAAIFAQSQARLRALKPPPGQAAHYRAWLAKESQVLKLLRTEATAFARGQIARGRKLDRQALAASRQGSQLAQTIGFNVCG